MAALTYTCGKTVVDVERVVDIVRAAGSVIMQVYTEDTKVNHRGVAPARTGEWPIWCRGKNMTCFDSRQSVEERSVRASKWFRPCITAAASFQSVSMGRSAKNDSGAAWRTSGCLKDDPFPVDLA